MADVNDIHPLSPVPTIPAGKQPGHKERRPKEENPQKMPDDRKPHPPDDPQRIDEYA